MSKPRTLREAWNSGNAFQVVLASDLRHTSMCPAAETVEEALEMAQAKGTPWQSRVFVPGVAVEVYRELPQSQIGCTFVEKVGDYVL